MGRWQVGPAPGRPRSGEAVGRWVAGGWASSGSGRYVAAGGWARSGGGRWVAGSWTPVLTPALTPALTPVLGWALGSTLQFFFCFRIFIKFSILKYFANAIIVLPFLY